MIQFSKGGPEVIEANDIIWYIIRGVRKKREELEASPSYQARKAEEDSGVLDVAKLAVVEMAKPNRAVRRAASKKNEDAKSEMSALRVHHADRTK